MAEQFINKEENSLDFLGNIIRYPNPTSGLVNVSSAENTVSWELDNSFGAVLIQEEATSQELKAFSLNLSKYSAGMYILRIQLKNRKHIIKKIIKE